MEDSIWSKGFHTMSSVEMSVSTYLFHKEHRHQSTLFVENEIGKYYTFIGRKRSKMFMEQRVQEDILFGHTCPTMLKNLCLSISFRWILIV